MHPFHKNHILATKVTPVGTFINASHLTFLLITYSIILFTTLGTVTRFFPLLWTHNQKQRRILTVLTLAQDICMETLEQEMQFLLVLSSTLLSSTVHKLLVIVVHK